MQINAKLRTVAAFLPSNSPVLDGADTTKNRVEKKEIKRMWILQDGTKLLHLQNVPGIPVCISKNAQQELCHYYLSSCEF